MNRVNIFFTYFEKKLKIIYNSFIIFKNIYIIILEQLELDTLKWLENNLTLYYNATTIPHTRQIE